MSTKETAVAKESSEAQPKIAPAAPEVTGAQWVESARMVFNVAPEIVVGALKHNLEQRYTKEHVQKAIKDFLDQPAKRTEG